MKTTNEEANTWLFKVVIIFIVAGFLLSLIPLAKAQETQNGKEPFPMLWRPDCKVSVYSITGHLHPICNSAISDLL